jgi:hypothetical protein
MLIQRETEGTGKLVDEKEKLVVSLMFLRNGHLSIPC